MDGREYEQILDELFSLARHVMDTHHIYPYVSLIVRDGVIVSKGYNYERESRDVTMQGDVAAIRAAQEALEDGDLSAYTLVSLFEPTILGFDVALWARIKKFVWCINASSLPDHYHKMQYGPLNYAENNPGSISITNGLREEEALELVRESKESKLYPDNLY